MQQLTVDIGVGSGNSDQSLAKFLAFSMQPVPNESAISSDWYFHQLNCLIIAHDSCLFDFSEDCSLELSLAAAPRTTSTEHFACDTTACETEPDRKSVV